VFIIFRLAAGGDVLFVVPGTDAALDGERVEKFPEPNEAKMPVKLGKPGRIFWSVDQAEWGEGVSRWIRLLIGRILLRCKVENH